MATVFVADVHLDTSRPHLIRLFEDFLHSDTVQRASALYMLGDLVEAWVGDDDDTALPGRIAQAIRSVSQRNIPVYFMYGNRDFLMGPAFAERCGMQLITADTWVRDIEGTPTLLMHGDTLCTDDVAYQQVRARVRTPEWRRQVLAMPLAERRELAARSREQSRAHTHGSASAIMDVNQDAVESSMRAAGVNRLIHGHTHRPALHNFKLDGRPAQRIVLGDWYQQGAALIMTPTSSRLEFFSQRNRRRD